MIDGLSIVALAAQCALAAPADIGAPFALAECDGKPIAVGIDSKRINASSLEEGIATNFTGTSANSASKRQAEPRGRAVAPAPTPHTEPSSPKWDVFNSNSNHPLLVYQGTRK